MSEVRQLQQALAELRRANAMAVEATQAELATKAPILHTHDDRYFTEAETTALLADKAAVTHTHAIADVTNLQTTLDGKAAAVHAHDDRYYTISEVDTLLAGAGSGLTQSQVLIRGLGA